MGNKNIHKLKIMPNYFSDVKNNFKKFEIRNNDRNFKVGDLVVLQEWEDDEYTGNEIKIKISYITDYSQPKNQVVFGFEKI